MQKISLIILFSQKKKQNLVLKKVQGGKSAAGRDESGQSIHAKNGRES